MSNIIEFPSKSEINYITGNQDRGEPIIVGVKSKDISIQLASDLHDILLGDSLIKRDELIAFVLSTGIYDEIKDEIVCDKDN